jgi:hypothetical protein
MHTTKHNLYKIFLVFSLIFIGLSVSAQCSMAHPGGTDSSGCHTCRTNCSDWGLSYGEYHCHNNKGSTQPLYPITSTYGSGGTGYVTPAPDYAYPSYPTTPSCPSMSSYDSLSGSCKCYSGYVVGTDYSGKEACVSADSKCTDLLGYGAQYNSLKSSCECRYGYIQSGGKCVSEITYCNNQLGLMSRYNSFLKKCECMSGYEFNGTSCIYKNTNYTNIPIYSQSSSNCPLNSHTSTTDVTKCQCDSGYQVNLTKDACVLIPVCSDGYTMSSNGLCITYAQSCKDINNNDANIIGNKGVDGSINCTCVYGYIWNGNKCITYTEDCKNSYGENVYGSKGDNGSLCYCENSYEWNSNRTQCIKQATGQYSASLQGSMSGNSNTGEIPEGALIRAKGGIDVYIVKYVDLKKFKRLILSPSVFNNYGHLKWSNIKEVDKGVVDSFTTSELVRAVGDDKVYKLYPQGDAGQKRLIKDNSVLIKLGLDSDSIYEINSFDRDSYVIGSVIE